MTAKRGKRDVNYRKATSPLCCRNCKFSYGPEDYRECKLVEGEIYPSDVCDLWESQQAYGFGRMDVDEDDDPGDHEYR